MKRTQSSESSPSSSPHKSKKAKTSAPVSHGLIQEQEDGGASGTVSGDQWTKVEKRKGKKMKKTGVKLDAAPPKFMYVGNEIVKRKEAVTVSDIRDFVLHIIADAPPCSWIRVDNPRSIQKVVVLLIPGLTHTVLSLPPLPTSATSNPNLPISLPLPLSPSSAPVPTPAPTSMELDDDARELGHEREEEAVACGGVPFICRTFSHALPTKAPGEATKMHSVLSSFFQGPVSGEEKRKRVIARIASERREEKNPTLYLLKLEQMIENDYPIPSYMADVFQKPEGWVETPEPQMHSLLEKQPTATAKIYAIDCEMCLTEDGKELTRVSVIDYKTGKVEYDTLVKPSKPIIDYLTRWSGITPAALAPVTTTLRQVQTRLLSLLSAKPTPILLGHSLESDLKALKLCHPKCIDTAIIYHHPRGRPLKPGLAWLTKKWCGREIQVRGEGGHDSEEDARACMELLKRKVENGMGYGEFRTDFESIFERMSRSAGHAGTPNNTIRTAVVDHGNPATWHGSKATTTVPCNTDEEVYEGVKEMLGSHEFVFGRFTGLADALGWITPKATATTEPAPAVPAAPSTSSIPPTPSASADSIPPAAPPPLQPVLSSLESRLSSLHASLPPRTAFLIFSGHSDPRKMSALNAKKQAFETRVRERMRGGEALVDGFNPNAAGEGGEGEGELVWRSQDARMLEEEVEKAKRGLAFFSVKV